MDCGVASTIVALGSQRTHSSTTPESIMGLFLFSQNAPGSLYDGINGGRIFSRGLARAVQRFDRIGGVMWQILCKVFEDMMLRHLGFALRGVDWDVL